MEDRRFFGRKKWISRWTHIPRIILTLSLINERRRSGGIRVFMARSTQVTTISLGLPEKIKFQIFLTLVVCGRLQRNYYSP